MWVELMIRTYKGRPLNAFQRVRVYRNLNTGCWSLLGCEGRHRGRVIGHADELTLGACTFVVSEPGRQRVIRDGHKNVHAYVEGIVADFGLAVDPRAQASRRLSYNPFRDGRFWAYAQEDRPEATDQPISTALLVGFDTAGKAWVQHGA